MASSSVAGWVYDVFLSFRGTDVRKTFVGHLYNALDQRGIRIFKDDEKLERGKSISPELIKNINESNIAVIVFSKNYASSSWCLDELVEILECSKTKRQTVLPIFYDVKASQVRKQKRSFAEAFREHEEIHKEEMERVHRWRAALKEAANISGFDLQDAANGDEAEFVQKIVQEISKRLQPKLLKVADHEVGIDSRANKVMMLLQDSADKLFVAICGTGGIGKTTVAKVVFNRMYNEFDGCCFLENVRAESGKHGLAKLQEKILIDTLMDKNVKISNFDGGINEIKVRLQKKKILVVLDDVDDENQLTSLVGIGHDCFGSRSRIIITTRDVRVFINYDAKIYEAELLDGDDALELFSWHAFKEKNPVEKYLGLSRCLKDYAQGLPLALKVLGSHLYKRDMQQWVSVWDGLKSNPPGEIQSVLEISYNGLDHKGKAIFLDIACFFNGCDKKFAMDIFENCGFNPDIRIQVLIERYLITISEYNKLWMHDLIQEMGREIVRQESKYRPEMQSRLWSYEDIYEVFAENKVTENIEAIMLSEKGLSLGGVDFFEGGLHVSADDFKTMKRLRILKISDVQLDGCLTYLPNELRYLDWKGYPREYLPSSFNPKKLVELNLSYSLIKGIGTNTKFLKMVKVLDFSYCQNLQGRNLNFSGLSFLEELYLRGCENLVEVESDDMKFLDKLKIVDLSYCKDLKKAPNLSGLPNLKRLYLCHCSKLEKFPEIQGDMKCLKELWLGETAIKELPPSVVQHLKRLRYLSMQGCKLLESLPSNIGEIESLVELNLEGTAIKSLPASVQHLERFFALVLTDCRMLESFPNSIGEMKWLNLKVLCLGGSGIKKLPSFIAQLTNLTELFCDNCNLDEESFLNLPQSLNYLNLSRNNFASLPASLTQLTELVYLDLNGCLSLQTLESLPSSILSVSAHGCVSLERYSIPTIEGNPFTKIGNMPDWIFTESHKLVENQGTNKPNVYYSQSELQEICGVIVLPGSEIPSWFSHIFERESDEEYTSVCLKMDPNSVRNLKGVSVCAIFEINQHHEPSNDDEKPFNYDDEIVLEINGHLDRLSSICRWIYKLRSDHIMLFHQPSFGWKYNSDGCYIEASLKTGSYPNGRPWKVKKWGIHPLMDR